MPKKKKKRTKDRSRLFQRMEFFLFIPFLKLIPWIPSFICKTMALSISFMIFRFAKGRRKITLDNLSVVFPKWDRKKIIFTGKQSTLSFVMTAVESLKYNKILNGPKALPFIQENFCNFDVFNERVNFFHRESDGCIFIVPHLGNWEFLLHAGTIAGIPLTVPVRNLDNPYLQKSLHKIRSNSGQEIVSKRGVLLNIRSSLKKGRSVALLADQNVGSSGEIIPFFGKNASTTITPAFFALNLNRAIVPLACCRSVEDKKFVLMIGNPIYPSKEVSSRRKEIIEMTIKLNEELEKFILQFPGQYLWAHDRWKIK
tara:strand:- start:283 stop:1221 length:939 start_codon:yes stop_codon:yes gene_type:complete